MNRKEQALQKKKVLKEKKAQSNLANKHIPIGLEAKPQSKNNDGVFLKERFKGLSNNALVGMAEACESKGAFIDARNLYSFAGERGSMEGLFQAGELAESGNLGTKDFISAFGYYLPAAKLGYVPAMEVVALSYFNGVGVEKNEMKSAAFILAAYRLEPNTVKETFNNLYGRIDSKTFKAGRAHANYTLFFGNRSEEKVVEGVFTEKQGQKSAIKKKIAAKVQPAMFADSSKNDGLKHKKIYEGLSNEVVVGLGESLEGRGEFVEARGLYLLAEERGSLEALLKLAELAESENLGPKDFVSSFNYSISAARSGHVPAMEVVAHNYFLGLGIEKDEIRSAAFICAAHALEPDLVSASFYQLKKRISKDAFDLGKTLSYSIFANDDQTISIERKVEGMRIKKKADAIKLADATEVEEKAKILLKANREARLQEYKDNVAKRNKEGWDPVWIFPLLFVVFPLIMWFLREARHG